MENNDEATQNDRKKEKMTTRTRREKIMRITWMMKIWKMKMRKT